MLKSQVVPLSSAIETTPSKLYLTALKSQKIKAQEAEQKELEKQKRDLINNANKAEAHKRTIIEAAKENADKKLEEIKATVMADNFDDSLLKAAEDGKTFYCLTTFPVTEGNDSYEIAVSSIAQVKTRLSEMPVLLAKIQSDNKRLICQENFPMTRHFRTVGTFRVLSGLIDLIIDFAPAPEVPVKSKSKCTIL